MKIRAPCAKFPGILNVTEVQYAGLGSLQNTVAALAFFLEAPVVLLVSFDVLIYNDAQNIGDSGTVAFYLKELKTFLSLLLTHSS